MLTLRSLLLFLLSQEWLLSFPHKCSFVFYAYRSNILPDSAVISPPLRITCPSAYMGLSKRAKVSPGPLDASWPLPEKAKLLAAILPAEDQEVLHHLVLCNFILPNGKDAGVKGKMRVSWQRGECGHRKVSDETISQSSANRQCNVGGDLSKIARMLKEAGKNERNAVHTPTLGCSCFECYLSFWSRWNASPNMRAISDILDIVDQHVLGHPSWQVLLIGLGGMGHRKQKEKAGRASLGKKGKKEASNKGVDEDVGMESSIMAGFVDDEDEEGGGVGGSVLLDHMPSLEEVDEEMQDVVVGEGVGVEEPNCNRQMRGGSVLARIFPDAFGGLAERLWCLVS